MTDFFRLTCNGADGPLCIDTAPTFAWSFGSGWERDVFQRSFAFVLSCEGVTVFERRGKGRITRLTVPKKLLRPFSQYVWTVSVRLSDGQDLTSKPQHFSTGLLGDRFGAHGALWMTAGEKYERQAIRFNKRFCLHKPVQRAAAYVFSTAWQRVSLNGVTLREDEFFLPPNTPYAQKCLYVDYPLENLKVGGNEFSLLLGGGYTSCYSQWGWRWQQGKGAYVLIRIRYADGTTEEIVSDASWEVLDDRIRSCDMYDGEDFDATYTPRRLCFAETGGTAPAGCYAVSEMPPVRRIRRIVPLSCRKSGTVGLFDMGEMLSGLVRICITAPRGHRITLQTSELIEPDGRLCTASNYKAKSCDSYISGGDAYEVYMPTFTYHGFRYLKIGGLTKDVTHFSVEAIVLSADVDSQSRFSCSDSTLERLYENTVRTLRNNFTAIPTDCPSRNERTPCLMDSQCVEKVAMDQFRMQAYYRKWLDDILVAADDIEDHGNPDWDGDRILLAYRLIEEYDDRDFVRQRYPLLKRYVRVFEEKSADHLWREGFGDWCHPNENTWESFHSCVPVVNSSLLFAVYDRMERIARVLGKEKDAAHYAEKRQAVRTAFLSEYLHGEIVGEGKQTEQLMPLSVGLLPAAEADRVFLTLKNCLDTQPLDLGIFGVQALARVLPERKAYDLLLELLHRPTYPGFLDQIADGATSLWEQWSSRGRMNSHDHAMFGGVGEMFAAGLGGIRPLENGYTRFAVFPRLPQGMSWLRCDRDTAAGVIRLAIYRYTVGVELHIDVPVNTTAEIGLPDPGGDMTLFDGELRLPDTAFSRTDGYIRMTVGSGRYRFRAVKKR